MKMKIKIKAIIFILVCSFILSGCTHDMNRREIDEINFIHVMGLDYSEGNYIITVIYSSSQGADPEKGSAGDEETSKARGETPYEAYENLKLKNKKAISIANIGYFLLGERACEKGIDICIDFISKDETTKMDSLIFVTKGKEASEFIEESMEGEQIIHEDLEAVEQKQQELLTRNDNTLVNILNEIENDMTSVIIPYLENEEKAFLIKGYAVFDKLTLVDYLDMETSSGVNFIKNIVREFPIYLDGDVSLAIAYTNTILKSELDNNMIKVVISVDFETMVKEVVTDEDIFNKKALESLTNKQNEYIKEVVKKATNYSIYHGRDILQVARLIENQHTSRWSEYEEDWEELVSEIQYELVINSKIAKSFMLSKQRQYDDIKQLKNQ